LHRLEKYLNWLIRFFDISPLETGGMVKILVYALWGFNALLFLGKDIDFTCEQLNFSAGKSITIQCTVLKKVSNTDLYVENFTVVKQTIYVVILPDDYILPICDVISQPRGRSPPYILFS
jgi:hypothetical protein